MVQQFTASYMYPEAVKKAECFLYALLVLSLVHCDPWRSQFSGADGANGGVPGAGIYETEVAEPNIHDNDVIINYLSTGCYEKMYYKLRLSCRREGNGCPQSDWFHICLSTILGATVVLVVLCCCSFCCPQGNTLYSNVLLVAPFLWLFLMSLPYHVQE